MTHEQFQKLRAQSASGDRVSGNSRAGRASTPCGTMMGMSGQGYGQGYSTKRKQSSQSTPSSPTRARKAQCTCLNTEQQAALQQQQYLAAQQQRAGSQTLPRNNMMSNSQDDLRGSYEG